MQPQKAIAQVLGELVVSSFLAVVPNLLADPIRSMTGLNRELVVLLVGLVIVVWGLVTDIQSLIRNSIVYAIARVALMWLIPSLYNWYDWIPIVAVALIIILKWRDIDLV